MTDSNECQQFCAKNAQTCLQSELFTARNCKSCNQTCICCTSQQTLPSRRVVSRGAVAGLPGVGTLESVADPPTVADSRSGVLHPRRYVCRHSRRPRRAALFSPFFPTPEDR